MDNRTNLSTRNNGVDNLPKPVQKRFTICPKHLQDHTKLSDHNNISYFSIKMWNKVFTYLEFHKNTSYLCQQTGQLKKLASLCTILSKTTLTVSVFISIFTNLSVVSLILGTMAPWTLSSSGHCLSIWMNP